jgi:hypothetical protein
MARWNIVERRLERLLEKPTAVGNAAAVIVRGRDADAVRRATRRRGRDARGHGVHRDRHRGDHLDELERKLDLLLAAQSRPEP